MSNEDKQDKDFLHRFAIYIISLAFAYIFAASFFDIPKENIRFVDTVLGFILGTVVSTIVQFFYGTSRGSQLKDAIISNVRSCLDTLDNKTLDQIKKENKDYEEE